MAYIVVRQLPTGRLSPSPNPFIHHTYRTAVTEARRLSRTFRGETIRVLSLLGKGYREEPNPQDAAIRIAPDDVRARPAQLFDVVI